MNDKEPASKQIPRYEKFNYFMGSDGETYRVPKPEFAEEIAQQGLARMAVMARHTEVAMARLTADQGS